MAIDAQHLYKEETGCLPKGEINLNLCVGDRRASG
jgi:hypothetical protein